VQANLTMSGKTSQQQRKLYDDLGLVWESIHAGGDALRNTPQATIDEAKAAGIKNITCSFPLYPAERATIMAGPTIDDWKRNIDAFNKIGELCKKSCQAGTIKIRPGRFMELKVTVQFCTGCASIAATKIIAILMHLQMV